MPRDLSASKRFVAANENGSEFSVTKIPAKACVFDLSYTFQPIIFAEKMMAAF